MGKITGRPGPDPGTPGKRKPVTIAALGEPKSHRTPTNPGRNSKMQPLDGSRECLECGKWHPRCRGHKKNLENPRSDPCMAIPTNGTGLCMIHGGRAPQVKAAAKRRNDKAEGIKGLVRLGETVSMGTTVDHLKAIIDRAATFTDDRWAEVVALPSLYIEETDKLGSCRLVVHPAVGLYTQGLDRLTNILIQCAKLGLEDRRLNLAKEHGDRLFAAFNRACDAAGLSDDQVDKMRLAFATELRPQGELAA